MTPPPRSYQFALTGYPLGHSLSPRIHAAALEACGLQGAYNLRPVPPESAQEGLAALFSELRAGKLDGLNVTIPHKTLALAVCDELSPAARAIGAANLISADGNQIRGDNSDAPGFLAGLERAPSGWQPERAQAIVLGAGGSARAVVYALASGGWQVTLLARRSEQAAAMCSSFAGILPLGSIQTGALAAETLRGLSADLVVNTTPVGMHPATAQSPWPEHIPLPARAVIYDLVYNPRQTAFLAQACDQGLFTIGGIYMLVEQAAISFERWTGMPAPRQAMLAAVQD